MMTSETMHYKLDSYPYNLVLSILVRVNIQICTKSNLFKVKSICVTGFLHFNLSTMHSC
jgi:hypothetical protein